jgi:hypothetical protein
MSIMTAADRNGAAGELPERGQEAQVTVVACCDRPNSTAVIFIDAFSQTR